MHFKMAADTVKSEEKELKVPFIKNGPRVEIVPGLYSVKFTPFSLVLKSIKFKKISSRVGLIFHSNELV